jgi:glycosyltransferase involved in cell wall biosynthesis
MWLRDPDAGFVCGSGDNRGTELIEPAGAVDVAERAHTARGDEAPEPDAVAAAVDAAALAGGTGRRLRILVHDFAGHPFQVDLSRALARRGHTVQHVHCVGYTSGKGAFDTRNLPNLTVVGLPTGGTFDRYSASRRFKQEVGYARRFDAVADAFRPDVMLACNVPLVAKAVTAAWCARKGVPWVFWLQDLHGVAMRREAEKRAGTAGKALGAGFEMVERALLRRADAVVSITPDFVPMLDGWGVAADRRTVIENWAPLSDLPQRPRDNAWRRRMGMGDRYVFLYSGTLGLKHRPEVLYALAEQHEGDADVVVISQGMGETRLREMLAERPLANLRLLPFQPIEDYPDILGAADTLIALLEPAAGTFSVPSKVLSYLCAGRPILAAIPPANLAARTIEKAGAGAVVPPDDPEAFLVAAKQFRIDAERRRVAGTNGRSYAESVFDTVTITDRFEGVIDVALGRSGSTTGSTRGD